MDVMFSKTGKKQNWVHAVRPDGSKVSFPWAAHPGLPHDAIHLVVEDVFCLRNGFWGLLAAGIDLMTLNSAIERARTGVKVKDLAGRDTTELYQAEALVACFSNEMLWTGPKSPEERRSHLDEQCVKWGVTVPSSYSDDRAALTQERLDALLARWQGLDAGQSLAEAITWL